mgnify:CR=1 FL=1
MIFDQMERRIKEMKELRRLETIKANRVQQEATDIKYHNLVAQVKGFINILQYFQTELKFEVSDSYKTEIRALLAKLQEVIKDGYANKDLVTESENDFKNIINTIKKDWTKHHTSLTSTTVNTLKIIGGIESDQVEACLTDIKNASTWQMDVTVYKKLKKALDSADSLIEKMSLDQDIIDFLTKMTSGKATFYDLNDKVMEWIKKESLEKRVKLSFTAR